MVGVIHFGACSSPHTAEVWGDIRLFCLGAALWKETKLYLGLGRTLLPPKQINGDLANPTSPPDSLLPPQIPSGNPTPLPLDI